MKSVAARDVRYTAKEYFDLVDRGALRPDDRVELLEGVIVAMAPQKPRHASGAYLADTALRAAVGRRAVVRAQLPLMLSKRSVPEPDIAVVPGKPEDYFEAHPRTALLIVEIAETSLAQDRLSKSRIYAAAAVPEYWLVNLKDMAVEVFRDPSRSARAYRDVTRAAADAVLELVALPGAKIRVRDLLPKR